MSSNLAKHKPAAALTKKAAELWDIGNRAEAEVCKLERAAIPYILVAGAAFHLAKAEVPHGQWEHIIEACSPLSLRTVQQRMSAVDSALMRLGFDLEPRAYETIVFASKFAKAHDRALLTTKYAAALTTAITDALSGKSSHQLELYLGIRAPKKLPPADLPSDDAADENDRLFRLATKYVENFEADVEELAAHKAQFDHDLLTRFQAACNKALNSFLSRPK